MTAQLTNPPNSRMWHLLLGSGATVHVFDLSLTGQLVFSCSECCLHQQSISLLHHKGRVRLYLWINRERQGGCGTLHLSEPRRWSQNDGKSAKTFLDYTKPAFLL